ncbi:MAG: hypothetical protein KC615_13785 [Anaerolineae bacterium]|nr:hypothetical protein [Anaerolineae bacterium]MCA9894053.1 hypothetical protein [Anaerolineae bacterium]
MPGKSRRNLFEEHIESENFDVSRLGMTYGMTELSSQVSELFASLPRPIDYRVWDQYLDDRQKLLCAQLTFEIIDHVIREQYLQETIHLSDDELVQMLTVPVALAILAEEMSARERDAFVLLNQPLEDEHDRLEVLTKPQEQPEPRSLRTVLSESFAQMSRIFKKWLGRLS